ncbi:MAG: ATP-binding protein [Candidatus Hydrogenedentales bacterium]|jgi:hypothetical protein
MKTIFETCVPREEVLEGELKDEMFAARLRDVIEQTADPVYGDPQRFFENTYPTEGLKTLIHEVFGRLSGKAPASSPFIRLETSFGGGKTHNLIALYHLAQGHVDGVPKEVVDVSWMPKEPCLTAGLVGSDLDPANGIDHGDVTTRTIWGEIAYQIGQAKGFKLLEKSDKELLAPGTQVLEKLIGDAPALIMLDELARYLRTAKAVQTANKKSDLAEQTVAFLMTLIEFAASKEKVSVVVTLADSRDAFTEETDTLKLELSEAKRVSARQERVITPTGETELAHIVTHRLFKQIDRTAAEETAAAYAECYAKLEEQRTDLPLQALRPEYTKEIATDYPFHPELLTTLNRKTSTIPNFQKTRGALRLLARVVRGMWAEKPKDAYTICIHNIDLGHDDIANDLTSRLERPAFRQVIEADIVSPRTGSVAHAQAADEKWLDAGKPPYARRAAINIFLHSLTQGQATGVDPAELMLAVLQPGDDPQLIRKAVSIMLAEEKGDPGTACWYLHWDGFRYRFKTEPSLEKVIQDELSMVGRVKAKGELDSRIRKVWKKTALKPVYFPSEAAELEDDAREPKLVILHYDAATSAASASAPPELVTKLFDHAGSMDGYRTYKNNVVFLVADVDQVERMVDIVQRYLAICRIIGDSDRMQDFTDEQRKKLKGMQESAELDVRVATTRAYRYLYYPSSDAPKRTGGLNRETLPAQDQGEVDKDQSSVVLRVLRQLQKVLVADDPAMPPQYVKAKAWPHGQESISTEDLGREFAKRIGLKILLDPNQLKKTVKTGISQGTWIYFDSAEQVGYGKPSPAPLVQLSEDMLLYTPEEAKRLNLLIKGVETPHTDTTDIDKILDEEESDIERQPKMLRARAEGTPAQAFQAIADKFHDKKAKTIRTLTVRCEGLGKEAAADARALGLAIPQLGKGNYRVEQTLNAEFGEGAGHDIFSAIFDGSWDRYKRVKQLTDAFGQEATKVNVKCVLRATFDEGLPVESDQFQSMRDIFASLGMGKIVVDAEQALDEEGSD